MEETPSMTQWRIPVALGVWLAGVGLVSIGVWDGDDMLLLVVPGLIGIGVMVYLLRVEHKARREVERAMPWVRIGASGLGLVGFGVGVGLVWYGFVLAMAGAGTSAIDPAVMGWARALGTSLVVLGAECMVAGAVALALGILATLVPWMIPVARPVGEESEGTTA